jgi:hypothetical protein
MNIDPEPVSFLDKLFRKTGRFYPIIILLVLQILSTPLLVILSIIPAHENAHLTLSNWKN